MANCAVGGYGLAVLASLPAAQSPSAHFSYGEADLWERSKVRLSEDWKTDGIFFLRALYEREDLICINADHRMETKKDGTQKAIITGAGTTMEACLWIDAKTTLRFSKSIALTRPRMNSARRRLLRKGVLM